MAERRRIHLREWRDEKLLSSTDLAERSGLSSAAIENIESGASDFTGAQLEALADALDCEPWRLIFGPPDPAADRDQFRTRLVAQMLRDICVEAVTTFDDLGRLDDLRKNLDAEEFWCAVATLFEDAMATIRRTSPSGSSAP